MNSLLHLVRFSALCSLFFAAVGLSGQTGSASTGVIAGRVFNSATREYIRNAEVRIEGSSNATISEDGGYYRLQNVPVGEVNVIVNYTGHESESTKLRVTAGETVTRDFELVPIDSRRTGDDVKKMAAYVVESEREGQAKSVAEQKSAMNVKQVMSTDNYGDMSEGNIGEFLKYMPGIVIDYVETDTRAARMGGMDAKYAYVTLDGNTMATGSSGSFGADTRQFEFESISMNNIESIEVNKTLTADMSADAPAGTVNLRTRSALDLKRAKYGYAVGLIANSYEYSLTKKPRHDDGAHEKARPRASFDYTNAFFNRKLGITLNGAFTNIFKEQFRHGVSYDYNSAQAIAAGHPLITGVNFKDGPKISEKSAGGIKLEYQPFPGLRMSASATYSYFDDMFANRNLNFVVNAADIDPASTMTKVIAKPTTNANTRIDESGTTDDKRKDQTNLTYVATYRGGPWTIDLNAAYSRQREHRGALQDNTLGAANIRLTRIGWTAERPSVDSPSWSIVQTAGPNWYDWSNYGRSDTQTNNATGSLSVGKTEEYTGRLDFKRVMSWNIPTSYKFGVAERVTTRARKQIDNFTSTFVGATGNQLTATMPQSMASFWIADAWGSNIGHLPVPDKEALGQLRFTHPEYFQKTEANLASELDSILASPQSNQETIKAGYLMQESRVGRWQLLGGLRYELTSTISSAVNIVPPSQNPFSIVNATTGVKSAAQTRDYVRYKNSRGMKTDWGEYHDVFPSFAAKYPITPNLDVKFGYNKAIKRPDLNKIAGTITIDTNASGFETITVPNPDLIPEHSERFSVMLEYYFKPAGNISVHLFQTKIKDEILDTADETTAEDAGFTDPAYAGAGYFFKTFSNFPGVRRYRGIEINWSQQLTFFRNELLRGISFFAAYDRYNASPRLRDGKYYTQDAKGGITWKFRKFSASVNATWTDETPTGSNVVSATARYFPGDTEFLSDRLICFVNVSYRLSKNTSVFISGDRAYDSGKTWFFKSDGRIRQMERYGSQWSIGLRGDY